MEKIQLEKMNYAENQEKWINLHNQVRYRPKYPLEPVVQYVLRNFKRGSNAKILDAGCGAGRHVVFMAEEGMAPYGLDFSSSGVEYTKAVLKEKGYERFVENVITGSCSAMPFEDNAFDGLISIGVLYYLPYPRIVESIKEFYRVLKPSGRCFVTVRSLEDYRFQSGKKTDEEHTVYVTESAGDRSASSENGMSMHFFSRDELADLFSVFDNVKIDDYIISHDNGMYRDCNYFLTAEKR